MIIKILLLLSLLVAALLAYRSPLSSRNAALRRLFALGLFLFGGLAIFNPTLVTTIAQRIGVGRGTDLLVYFLAVASLLGWLSLWRRIFELEQRLVLLTRSNALHEAQHRMSAGEPVYDPAPRHDEDA
jgi:hypothetical protein